MASRSIDRITADLSERMDSMQEWLQTLSKNVPDAKQLRSYLPGSQPKRSVALPVMLAIGGLAFVGAITLMSATANKRNVISSSNRKAPSPQTNKSDDEEKTPSTSSMSTSTP
jgi:hypothetical protein